MDARSYAAAVGNRARGGGVECPEYYPNAEITFMNLANIHTIRQSHQRLRILLHSQPETTSATWFSQLDATKWLHHLSGLFKASLKTCTALHHEQRPVIVHCSDGWDRTPQIVALSELMLDPYYRSIDGFQVRFKAYGYQKYVLYCNK
jgi:myotubularin-related protein 3/4